MPTPRKSGGSSGSRKSTQSPKKKPKMMNTGDENEMIDSSRSNSISPPTTGRRGRSSGGADKTPQQRRVRGEEEEEEVLKEKEEEKPRHARGRSPTTGIEYYNSYSVDLMHNRKVYRAPFKVHLMQWNPRMDLLALVSNSGEVCMKRAGWKTAWKLNVNSEERILHDFPVKKEEKKGTPTCVEWSPDGMALAVGMNNGYYHLIDAEAGVLRFTWTLGTPIVKMSWKALTEKMSHDWSGPQILETEDRRAMAEVAESIDEKVQAVMEKTIELETQMLPRSLYKTALTVVMDDLSIAVLLGGVLCVAKVDFESFMIEKYGVAVLAVTDAFVDSRNDHELIVMYSGGAGTVPVRTGHCSGSYKWKMNEDEVGGCRMFVKIPSEKPAPSSLERHNHVMGIELAVMKMISEKMWLLAARFVRMTITVLEMTEMYDVIQKIWQTESTKVMNRFNGCGFAMGEALISQILAGVSSDLMHEWVEKKMGGEGAAALRELYEKHLVDLVENLRSTMLSSAFNLHHQLERWEDETRLIVEECVDPCLLLLGDCPAARGYKEKEERGGKEKRKDSIPFMVDRGFYKSLDRSGVHQLSTVVMAMVNVAEINGYQISQLARWLSLLHPVLKSSKKQVHVVRTCRKFYVYELMKYIVATFVEPSKRAGFSKLLFRLDEMAENVEEVENEVEYLSLSVPHPMEGEEWYEQAKEDQPLPYNVLTRDRYFYRPSMTAKRQKARDAQQADLDARSRYVQLGMNCPSRRREEAATPTPPAKTPSPPVVESGPAARTRSHSAAAATAASSAERQQQQLQQVQQTPTAEPGPVRREEKKKPFTGNPETVRNRMRQMARQFQAAKGQYPKMRKTEGEEVFDIDKVAHFFRAGVPLPESVLRLLEGEENDSISPSIAALCSLPDALSACVASVAGVFECLTRVAEEPTTMRWCNELLSKERNTSIEEGRMDRWRLAPEAAKDWAERQVWTDYAGADLRDAVCVAGWNRDGIWMRTLFAANDDEWIETHAKEKLQWAWKIRDSEGGRSMVVDPAIGVQSTQPPGSPMLREKREEQSPDVRTVQPEEMTPTVRRAEGGGEMEPLSIKMDEDSCSPRAVKHHGEPIEIKQVWNMKSGTVLAVVVFENEQGKRQRLVQLNPYMGYNMLVHEEVVRSELYESWELSREREMGAALSENATRVTWFELKKKA